MQNVGPAGWRGAPLAAEGRVYPIELMLELRQQRRRLGPLAAVTEGFQLGANFRHALGAEIGAAAFELVGEALNNAAIAFFHALAQLLEHSRGVLEKNIDYFGQEILFAFFGKSAPRVQ